MAYIPIIAIICIVIYYLFQSDKINRIKENGIRVTGIIIHNQETGANSRMRLGGNINNPTIKFVTVEGQEIVGKPVVGFISQYEVIVPSEVDIIYDSTNPYKFCVDLRD